IENYPVKSTQRVMQERLTKAARRVLKIKNTATPKTLNELIEEVLLTENPNDFHGMGAMDNGEALFNELAKELESEGSAYNQAEMVQFGQILKNATFDV